MKMFYFMLATLCLLACGGGVRAAPAEAATQETKYLDGTGLPKCSRESNLHEECIKNITNTLIKRLRLGDPELNIVPYDPLLIDRLSFQYSTPIVTGRISVRNVKLFGFAEHSIEKLNVEFDGDKIKLRIKSKIPKVNIMGNYKAEMQVNQLHIKPKGNFNVTLFDVENQVVADGEIYTKDGRRFFRLTDIEANPKIGDMIIKANGIFPDPELDELALSVANNYWRDIYGIILPETRKSWQPVMLRLINQALLHVPIDQFIQPSE